jgi:hypothetical protein
VSAFALGALAWMSVESWLSFFFPDAALIIVLSVAVGFALFCALIAGHLALSSTIPRQRRWRLGAITAGTSAVLIGLGSTVGDETFTAVATFSGVLKPVAPSVVPATSIDGFGAAMLELKDEVDEMAAKKP